MWFHIVYLSPSFIVSLFVLLIHFVGPSGVCAPASQLCGQYTRHYSLFFPLFLSFFLSSFLSFLLYALEVEVDTLGRGGHGAARVGSSSRSQGVEVLIQPGCGGGGKAGGGAHAPKYICQCLWGANSSVRRPGREDPHRVSRIISPFCT